MSARRIRTRLLNVQLSSPPPRTGAEATHMLSTGVFVTPQSVVAFPIASTVVTVIWKVLGTVFPGWGSSSVTLLAVSLLVGLLLYSMSDTEESTVGSRIAGILVAVINSFFLAASALGIDVAAL